PKRLVTPAAVRANKVDDLDTEAGSANADDLHRRGIDEIAIAFEPHAVAVDIGIWSGIIALIELAPDALERLPNVSGHARGVIEPGIEDRFHDCLLRLLWPHAYRIYDIVSSTVRSSERRAAYARDRPSQRVPQTAHPRRKHTVRIRRAHFP